jgi:hypothetical protein
LLIFAELAVVTGIALLFSVSVHPIEGAVLAFVFTLSGHATGSLLELGETILERSKAEGTAISTSVIDLITVLYIVLPNFDNFNLRNEAAQGLSVGWDFVALSSAYGLLYSGVLVVAASWSFSRRQL